MKPWKAILLAATLAVTAAVASSQGAIWQWSKTANTNATADPSINWSEGMSPSSVNDSARAMMARVAEWRDDLSGLLTTAGTSTAYTVTTNQGFASVPNDGQAVAVTMHATNGTSATLRADGGTVYPIQTSAGTAVTAGVLLSGTPYTMKFKAASSAWVLHNYYSPTPFVEIPVGSMVDYFGTTVPSSNYVFPFGQCLSRGTYTVLFALIGVQYGACDGVTTFGIPDMRGQIAATLDSLGGVARNLLTSAGSGCAGTTMGSSCGSQNVTMAQSQLPNVNFSVSIGAGQGSHDHPGSLVGQNSGVQGLGGGTGLFLGTGTFSSSQIVVATATLPSMTGFAASGGSGLPIVTLPPLRIVTKLLRAQ